MLRKVSLNDTEEKKIVADVFLKVDFKIIKKKPLVARTTRGIQKKLKVRRVVLYAASVDFW